MAPVMNVGRWRLGITQNSPCTLGRPRSSRIQRPLAAARCSNHDPAPHQQPGGASHGEGSGTGPSWWQHLAASTAALGLLCGAAAGFSATWTFPASASVAGDRHVGVEATGQLASALEDNLRLLDRQIESRLASAIGAVSAGLRLSDGTLAPATPEEAERVNQSARQLITEVWEVVDQNYLDARRTGFDAAKWTRLRDEALSRRYSDAESTVRSVNDMLAQGVADPYCRFIRAPDLAAMAKFDISGVGLNLGTAMEFASKTGLPLPLERTATSGGVFVVGFSQGSPAGQAAMKQGDEVVGVDGVTLVGQTPFQVASLIQQHSSPPLSAVVTAPSPSSAAAPVLQASPSTLVTTLQLRGVDGQERSVQLQRPASRAAAAPLPSPVQYSLDKNKVGQLRLSTFNARSQRDLAAAMRDLAGRGATSYVLDLRDNRGGLVSEGLEVAALFLNAEVPIVSTESRAIPHDTQRTHGPALAREPLLVLVNDHTASASEIVAGALQDNCRAVLAGSRTYGKGIIQSVYELQDGNGIVLTVGKYLTPRGTDIDRFGIQPNFSSTPTAKQAAAAIKACLLQPQPV